RFLNNTAAVRTAKMTGVPKTKTILRGKTYTIQAVTVPYYSDEKILFRSSDRRIATVNSKGVVKGIRKGTAVITVQSGAKKLNCKITVK
ncbi:MAG: Ig-like domain-containing protein, partial [Agathobacter sp.]|nr:Ig-like domain-containing protein [Agathobacter sp.]